MTGLADPGKLHVFAIIAVLVFVFAGGAAVAVSPRTWWAMLVCAGLALLSAAVYFLA